MARRIAAVGVALAVVGVVSLLLLRRPGLSPTHHLTVSPTNESPGLPAAPTTTSEQCRTPLKLPDGPNDAVPTALGTRSALEILRCSTDFSRGRVTKSLVADYRALGANAAELLADELIAAGTDGRRCLTILSLLTELGNVGAHIEDKLASWGQRPENEFEQPMSIEALLAQGSAEGRVAAAALTELQGNRVRQGANIESQQILGRMIKRLSEGKTAESVGALAILSDDIEDVDPLLSDLGRLGNGDAASERMSEITNRNEILGTALLALARIDTPQSNEELVRRILAPKNEAQKRYALEALVAAITDSSEGEVAHRYGAWAHETILTANSASDPTELAAALRIVAVRGGMNLDSLLSVPDQVAMDNSFPVRPAWANAVAKAALEGPNASGLEAAREMLTSGSDRSAPVNAQAKMVAVVASSGTEEDSRLLAEILRSGEPTEVMAVIKGAPASYWDSKGDLLVAAASRFKETQGVHRQVTYMAVDKVLETADDPRAALAGLENPEDKTLSRYIDNNLRKAELGALAQLSGAAGLQAIMARSPNASAQERSELLDLTAALVDDEGVTVEIVAEWIATRTLPVMMRATLARAVLQLELAELPSGFGKSLAWLVLDAAQPEECRDVFRLLTVVAYKYPSERKNVQAAILPWFSAGHGAPCSSVVDCVPALQQVLGDED